MSGISGYGSNNVNDLFLRKASAASNSGVQAGSQIAKKEEVQDASQNSTKSTVTYNPPKKVAPKSAPSTCAQASASGASGASGGSGAGNASGTKSTDDVKKNEDNDKKAKEKRALDAYFQLEHYGYFEAQQKIIGIVELTRSGSAFNPDRYDKDDPKRATAEKYYNSMLENLKEQEEIVKNIEERSSDAIKEYNQLSKYLHYENNKLVVPSDYPGWKPF